MASEQDRSDTMDIIHARANKRQTEALARYKRRITREIKDRLANDLLAALSDTTRPDYETFGPNELRTVRKALAKL